MIRILFALLFLGGCQAISAGEAPHRIQPREVTVAVGERTVRVTLAVFSSAQFAFRVIDNPGSYKAEKYQRLPEAMRANDCVAGCNGGFFVRDPVFAPVGGMISEGRRISAVDHARWMKGLLVVRNGQPALESVETFQDTPDVTELLQSGTWLVRNGQSETDNSRPQVAARTFVGHDGRNTWVIGVTGRCSLHELAALLRDSAITTVIDLQAALNFDGGPSTGLWIKRTTDDFYVSEGWPVRNYIGLVPRVAP